MSFKVRVLRLVILPLFLGGLISCSSFAKLGNALSNQGNLPLTNIAQVPQETQETTIYLKGTVASQAPFVGGGAYQLKDATGTIWVISQGKLPNIGEEVAIEGKLAYQSIPIASQEMGEFYVLEVQPVEASRLVDKSSLISPETNSQATNLENNTEITTSENTQNNQETQLQATNSENNSNNSSVSPQTTSPETATKIPPTSAVISNTNLTQPQDLAISEGANSNKKPQTVEIKPNNPQIATTSEPVAAPAIIPEKPPAAIAPTRPKPALDLPFLPHKENKKQ